MKHTLLASILGLTLSSYALALDGVPSFFTPCQIKIKTTNFTATEEAQVLKFNYKTAQRECSVGLESSDDWLFTALNEDSLVVNIDENTSAVPRVGVIRIGSHPPLTLTIKQKGALAPKEVPTPKEASTPSVSVPASSAAVEAPPTP